ncbi:Putative threonine efflux protein, RhtB family protein [Oceanicola granulosus HTCC2516]|uniref:Putative threonine efflux protein, RhtB family protein n=1 Tax=Oceanicola granulosus (strain ATCC BAA-861 / DSM 15982 / KCTC 12143 / HTCC2516) TaxID=314256 RepID=Q2CG52_OCEGH|nr:LysE family transporter [Oceanicola granulosus]EAR51677.1 Putative threonine efflux protein, RhtB family protein [Oceanicola granulosus HTCC2516]
MSAAALFTILAIHLAAAISPGPSFVVAVRTAAASGFRPAAGLALGFGIGAALWATLALAGLALLFELVPGLLTALKVIGGAYLVWLALKMWRHADAPLAVTGTAGPTRFAAAVRTGLFTFLANPKTAVFFGAVFIGLVPPGTGTGWLAAIVALVLLDEVLWYLLVARLFSLPRARAAYLGAKAWVDRGLGGALGVLGLRVALG